MSLTRSYLVTLLLYVSIVNQLHLPLVRCQDEESPQCIPKKTFVIQDAKNRNDMAHLKALTEGSGDDTVIRIPPAMYLELFKDPVLRGHLIGHAQKLPDVSGGFFDDSEEIDAELLEPGSQKRSIAMLAKNDDLPISIQDRLNENQDDEEKRTVISSGDSEPSGPKIPREYFLPRSVLDAAALTADYPMEKRNVGTLARDFALPQGRRNIASMVRDQELQGKGNAAEDQAVSFAGKRNVASLARTYTLPQTGKRNVGSIARDYGLPYGKRNLGSLARTGDFPWREQGKRSVSSLAKNMAWPITLKRGISIPSSVILRAISNRRSKKEIDFSEEYPMPVMQNTNGFDYEDMMDTLGGQYLNAEKRFMGSVPELQLMVEQSGYPETFQASKRHIGSLAQIGWLPPLGASRFSRSPRYLVGRENPGDESSTNNSSAPSTRSLRPHFKAGSPHVQALHEDCRHGFKRFLLSTTDNFLRKKFPKMP
nr:neuropeptide-like 1 isoform X2 [Nomia melanderi]